MNRTLEVAALAFVVAGGCAQGRQHDAGAGNTPQALQPASAVTQRTGHGDDARLADFIPDAMTLHMTHRSDLDGDGDQDVLLVLGREGAAAATEPRSVVVLQRGPGGQLAKTIDSPRAVLCERCGGMTGDPLVSIDARERGFALHFEGGSRELWSKTYEFAFDPSQSTWLLTAMEHKVLDRLDGSAKSGRLTPQHFGVVPLERFDPSDVSGEP